MKSADHPCLRFHEKVLNRGWGAHGGRWIWGCSLCVPYKKKISRDGGEKVTCYIQSHGVTSETFVYCGEKEGKVLPFFLLRFRLQAEFKELRNAVGFKVRLINTRLSSNKTEY